MTLFISSQIQHIPHLSFLTASSSKVTVNVGQRTLDHLMLFIGVLVDKNRKSVAVYSLRSIAFLVLTLILGLRLIIWWTLTSVFKWRRVWSWALILAWSLALSWKLRLLRCLPPRRWSVLVHRRGSDTSLWQDCCRLIRNRLGHCTYAKGRCAYLLAGALKDYRIWHLRGSTKYHILLLFTFLALLFPDAHEVCGMKICMKYGVNHWITRLKNC